MTNGEKIKATFPHYDIEVYEHKGYVRVFYKDFYITYPLRWWDAEYEEPTTKNDSEHNLCDSCINYRCEFQSGIVRTKCAFYMPPVTPQETRWILVSEKLPEEHICDDGYHEPSKSVLVQMKSGAMHTARYWSRYDKKWLDLNYPTTDEVIAWMSLPEPYSEVEE